MKHEEKMLCYIGRLPLKIVQKHTIENLPEFLLYEMCGPDCFDFHKAAYFIDNPDFNCVKGIAGFTRDQSPGDRICVWETPDEFTACMRQSTFNQKVRGVSRDSYTHCKRTDEQFAYEIADELEMGNPQFCSWSLKNDNHGLFIYEPCNSTQMPTRECVLNGVCLLSFCPIY